MKIEFHPNVYKELQQLPKAVFAAALDKIITLASDPRPNGATKLAGAGNDWRVRIGQYRIVYEINDRTGVITIMRVAKRSDAYR